MIHKKTKWGYSTNKFGSEEYSMVAEWNKAVYWGSGDSNRSGNTNSDINYCSRIPWYGYKMNGIDINSDPTNSYNLGKGYLILPDELADSASDWIYYTKVWGQVGKDSCGNPTYGYKNQESGRYRATTTSYNWHNIPAGFTE